MGRRDLTVSRQSHCVGPDKAYSAKPVASHACGQITRNGAMTTIFTIVLNLALPVK